MNYTERDPETGELVVLVENALVDFPCLKQKDTRFRIAFLGWDGSASSWYSHAEDGYNYMVDTLDLESIDDIPLHSWVDAMRAIIRLRGNGWLTYVYPESHDLTRIVAYAKIALQAKTHKDQTILVAKFSKKLLGKEMLPTEVWDSLPKHFLPELGALYAKAIELQLAEPEAQG